MKELKNFRKEYDDHIGAFVLSDWMECVLYMGTYEDDTSEEDWDAYYKCINTHGEITFHSCVGGLTILRDKIDKGDYETIKSGFKANLLFHVNSPISSTSIIEEVLEMYFKDEPVCKKD